MLRDEVIIRMDLLGALLSPGIRTWLYEALHCKINWSGMDAEYIFIGKMNSIEDGGVGGLHGCAFLVESAL